MLLPMLSLLGDTGHRRWLSFNWRLMEWSASVDAQAIWSSVSNWQFHGAVSDGCRRQSGRGARGARHQEFLAVATLRRRARGLPGLGDAPRCSRALARRGTAAAARWRGAARLVPAVAPGLRAPGAPGRTAARWGAEASVGASGSLAAKWIQKCLLPAALSWRSYDGLRQAV